MKQPRTETYHMLTVTVYLGLFVPVADFMAQINWPIAWGVFWLVVFAVLSIAGIYLLLGFALIRLIVRVKLRTDRVYMWIIREWKRDHDKLHDTEIQCDQWRTEVNQFKQIAADANRAQDAAERSLAAAQQHIRDQDSYIKDVQAELVLVRQKLKEAREHVA